MHNDEFRQQIIAAKEVDLPMFLALCMSFDSFEVQEDKSKIAERAKIVEKSTSLAAITS